MSGKTILVSGIACSILTLIDRHFIHEPITIQIFSWLSLILTSVGLVMTPFEEQ